MTSKIKNVLIPLIVDHLKKETPFSDEERTFSPWNKLFNINNNICNS